MNKGGKVVASPSFGANNKPVGSAGQPQGHEALKKEVPEDKKSAIERRMAKAKDKKKK